MNLLTATKVFDDGAVDSLTGGVGTDWFFANDSGLGTLDGLLDKIAAELVKDL